MNRAESLSLSGLDSDIAHPKDVDFTTLQYDCVFLHRVPFSNKLKDYIDRAQENGTPVICDLDDLIFDVSVVPYMRSLEWMSRKDIRKVYQEVTSYYQTLSLCKSVIVSTMALANEVHKVFPGISCFVNHNTVSDAQIFGSETALQIERSTLDRKLIRFGYFSGTRTHNVDFSECARTLRTILQSNPHSRLMIVGHLDLGKEFNVFREQIEQYPLLPWQDLFKLYRKVDINLAPLERDNPFTRCKSDLKWLEAGIMGVPTVASEVQGFMESLRDGENGFLCRSEEDWYRCLTKLIEDPDHRSRVGTTARNEIISTRTTKTGSAGLLRIIHEIFRNTLGCSRDDPRLVGILDSAISP